MTTSAWVRLFVGFATFLALVASFSFGYTAATRAERAEDVAAEALRACATLRELAELAEQRRLALIDALRARGVELPPDLE